MRSESTGQLPKPTRTQQARRADIIAAAITVINRDGYASASVQRVAEEAGTSKSTVLYHFKSKAEIEKALVGSIFEDGAAYMAPFITRARTYRGKLRAYLTSNLQFIANNAPAIAALLEIERNIGHQTFTDSSTYNQDDAPMRWLKDMLINGQKAGEFNEFNPLVTAISIRLVVDGSAQYILTHPSLDITQYITEIVRLFDAAIAKKGGHYITPI
ncbi:MAG TPA: TetR/AcrR family transcriptional regulator [Candidatus Saccharimonadia bacterium]|nr:TetR/AcrR family transcriptional regulator [Candidatus Saccharimonadia bacterium]